MYADAVLADGELTGPGLAPHAAVSTTRPAVRPGRPCRGRSRRHQRRRPPVGQFLPCRWISGIGVPPYGRAPCPATPRHTRPGVTRASRATPCTGRGPGPPPRERPGHACWRPGRPGDASCDAGVMSGRASWAYAGASGRGSGRAGGRHRRRPARPGHRRGRGLRRAGRDREGPDELLRRGDPRPGPARGARRRGLRHAGRVAARRRAS